ncbi:MAG: terpene cyclase/mutase family protein, partial [Candidatus Aminicenantes bacterium]|nr:terpene cyclase/mutase family protein [Candidatus Aminicenantes bacterium]
MKNTFTIKLLFLIFPFMVQFAFGMQASGITENEPNNSIKEAEKISFPGAVYGTLEGVDDRDFYRLDIPSGGLDTLYFTLKIKGNCNPAVRLLNEKGETLTEADFFPVGSDEYLTSLDLKEGAYYVVVDRGRPKGKEEGSYVLTFDQVPEVNPANVKTALNRALDYIVSQQQEDGSFPGRRGDSGGIPSMAIQALMGADCVERNDWDAIYKGIDYLKSLYHDPSKIKSERGRQLHGGAIYRRDEMYDNGMALTTLIEAHVLGVEGLSPIIQGGLEYLMRSQLTDERPADLKGPIPRDSKYFGGWRYMAESVDADLSVTGWQIIALIAARKAGFKVPQKRLDYALEFVRRCYVEG